MGVLLFTPLLLLLPTVAVFHALLAGLHLGVAALRLLLALCAQAATSSPLAAAAVRLMRPGLFPGARWPEEMSCGGLFVSR